MDDRASPEFIPAAIGDVGTSGLRSLLWAPAQKISSSKLHTSRTHDRYTHVSIGVVHDVPHGVLTERVADLTIDGPVFPGYESPCTNERIKCHCLSLLLCGAERREQ